MAIMAIQVKFQGCTSAGPDTAMLLSNGSFFRGATGDDPGLSNVLKEQPWRRNYGVSPDTFTLLTMLTNS